MLVEQVRRVRFDTRRLLSMALQRLSMLVELLLAVAV